MEERARIRALAFLILWTGSLGTVGVSVGASPATYVHPNAPACGGPSPCFATLHEALTDVDQSGTVTVLANITDSVTQSFGKTGITILGVNPTIAVNGGVSLGATEVMSGWTIRDLVFTQGIAALAIAASITLQDLSTTSIRLGEFPADTSASITIRRVSFPGDPASKIEIRGGPGVDIGGAITIADNVNVSVLEIVGRATNGNDADITSVVTVSGNQLLAGANVVVEPDATGGGGRITGSIDFQDNTMGAAGAIRIGGSAATAVQPGPVVMRRNTGGTLVVSVTAGNWLSSTIGVVEATDNHMESIVIRSGSGGPLSGPVTLRENTVVDKGGGDPRIEIEGWNVGSSFPAIGSNPIEISGTTGAPAISLTLDGWNGHDGIFKIQDNLARSIRVSVEGTGSVHKSLSITNNSLPSAPQPDSLLLVRTPGGGAIYGRVMFELNTVDRMALELTGYPIDVEFLSNTFRSEATFTRSGPGAWDDHPRLEFRYNSFEGPSSFTGVDVILFWNRVMGTATFAPDVTGRADYNWWGCNRGPGMPGCTAGTGSVPVYPWLKFFAWTDCTSPTTAVQRFHVGLTTNDPSEYRMLPGMVAVSSSEGVVLDPVVPLQSTATVVLPPRATAIISSRLDSQVFPWPATCDPDQATVALYDANSADGTFYLRNRNASGFADRASPSRGPYGGIISGDVPLLGDWDGRGRARAGIYDYAAGKFVVVYSDTSTYARSFAYGPAGAGWRPIAGDWDGDGTDTVGLYDPATGAFYLRNALSVGYADLTFTFGPALLGWLPIAGDWDGDGTDTVGLYAPASSSFFLRNSHTSGYADISFPFGPAGTGWLPIAGDWDGDGTDTVGLYDPATGAFYLRNALSVGYADLTFTFGPGLPGWLPLAGDFDGPL